MKPEIQMQIDQRTKCMNSLGVRIANNTVDSPDFSELSALSRVEQNVLPVTEADLMASFQAGMSAVFLKENRAVGHARFTPLLDQNLSISLGLPPDIPQIWEMGTGLMAAEYRGQGINIVLRHHLIQKFRDQMVNGQILALATTKTPELRSLVDNMAELFEDSSDPYPLDFRFINRESIPMIAPFTCVCTPDFGSGYQFGNECTQAEKKNGETQLFRKGRELPLISAPERPKLACTVFISSSKLATETNQKLTDKLGSRQNTVVALLERGYFEW